MQLFIGGSNQEKLNIVLADILKNDKINEDLIFDCACDYADFANCAHAMTKCKILNHFHVFIRRFYGKFGTENAIEIFFSDILEKNPELIIIGDEIGYGIVPIDKDERLFRENYGRVMCCLAKKACKVTRIVCGLSQVIKQ